MRQNTLLLDIPKLLLIHQGYNTNKANYTKTGNCKNQLSLTWNQFHLTPKIITQQSSKVKILAKAKSKAADFKLQLDVTEKCILPKECSQLYEIKTVNSKNV